MWKEKIYTQKTDSVKRYRERKAICKPTRGAWNRHFPHCPQEEPTLPTHWFRTSSLHNSEVINLCHLSHFVVLCSGSPSNYISEDPMSYCRQSTVNGSLHYLNTAQSKLPAAPCHPGPLASGGTKDSCGTFPVQIPQLGPKKLQDIFPCSPVTRPPWPSSAPTICCEFSFT